MNLRMQVIYALQRIAIFCKNGVALNVQPKASISTIEWT